MWRVNQKVVCVAQHHDWTDRVPCYEFPSYGIVYEIRGVRRHEDNFLYLLLREIVNARPCSCRLHTTEPAFSAEAFRPLVSDEIKNEHVIKIINKAKRLLEKMPERAQAYDRKRERLHSGVPIELPGFDPDSIKHLNCRCSPETAIWSDDKAQAVFDALMREDFAAAERLSK